MRLSEALRPCAQREIGTIYAFKIIAPLLETQIKAIAAPN